MVAGLSSTVEVGGEREIRAVRGERVEWKFGETKFWEILCKKDKNIWGKFDLLQQFRRVIKGIFIISVYSDVLKTSL